MKFFTALVSLRFRKNLPSMKFSQLATLTIMAPAMSSPVSTSFHMDTATTHHNHPTITTITTTNNPNNNSDNNDDDDHIHTFSMKFLRALVSLSFTKNLPSM